MSSQQECDNDCRPTYTTSNGAPVLEPYASERVDVNGPLLLQDFHHLDLLSHFNRERIPERVVHAKGAGAHGYFEVTNDISDLTCAELFSHVGNRVDVTVRFSLVSGESGSADTNRDPRGFAIKLKTKEGNMDWVFNNTPIFFLRDPAKFPHFIHTQKRDPQTHLKDADMFWDYLSQNPESIHQVIYLFGDRGIPKGFHKQHGFSGHTLKFVNKDGKFTYVRIHVRADGGFETLEQKEATRLAGEDPDYGTRMLFEAIKEEKYPSWSVEIQTMTPDEAVKFRYNILDLTKVWSQKQFKRIPIGRLVLNKNPENYFAEIEQVAFSPSHLVPGIEPSADPVLQSRLFAYPDTHRYRLGVNYQQLPVNKPCVPIANFQRDGFMTFFNQGSRPNYKSSICPLRYKEKCSKDVTHERWLAHAQLVLIKINELDFEQPRRLWQDVFDKGAKERFIENVSAHLGRCKHKEIIDRQLSVFATVDRALSHDIAYKLGRKDADPLEVEPACKAWKFHYGEQLGR